MSRRTVLVVLVACLAVLAGCSTGPSNSQGTPTPDTENPWRGEELVVALDVPDGQYDYYRPLLEAALSYWEDNAGNYAFPVSFRLEPNASDPDIRADVVEEIYDCAGTKDTAGCALTVEDWNALPDTVEFEVRSGLSEETTTDVMKHELGHVLGLRHGDRPKGVMAPTSEGALRDRPDATERALPWNESTLTVAVDLANVSDGERGEVREQVDRALDFYEDGANGTVPANVTFENATDETSADVRITFADGDACGGGPACTSLDGSDVDADEAFEYYDSLAVTLADVDTEATGWYVARSLAVGFGNDERHLPPELRNATYFDRRSEWWR